MKKIAALAILILVSVTSRLMAQSDTIQEIRVGRISLNDSLWKEPSPTTRLQSATLKRQAATDISQAINLAPGVHMQSGTLNTNRITIRGIGARTPFGSNRVRAFFGFIPLTSGDSETTIEDLDLNTLSSVEIIRGPMSSVYGAGLGGAILLQPEVAKTGTRFTTDNTYGSFGLQKNGYQFSNGGASGNVNISHHTLRQDGWRQNSAYFREGTTLSAQLFKSEKRAVTILANSTWLRAFIPSSINRDDFENHPDRAAATWLAAKGFEQYRSYLLGASYENAISGKWRYAAAAFISGKDGYEPRPFDILEQLTAASGLRGQVSGQLTIAGQKIELLSGFEYFADRVRSDYFENLYQDDGNGSIQGMRISADHQRRQFVNLYGRLQTPISKTIVVQAGLNVNKTNFSLGQPADETKRYGYKVIWSPQGSLVVTPSENAVYHFSAASGFSLPSLSETLTADGIVNPDIRPETGWTFEGGGKWRLWRKRLMVDITLFHMNISNLLVARRVDDDRYVGINAGKTVHTGVETVLNLRYPLSEMWSLDAMVSGSVGRYRFDTFKDGESDFSGNELTAVPSRKLNAICTLNFRRIFLQPGFNHVSSLYANDANTEKVAGYGLFDIKSGITLQIAKKFTTLISAGCTNVFDAEYASMVAVNALSNGGKPRYFYPGTPRSFFLQLLISFDAQ